MIFNKQLLQKTIQRIDEKSIGYAAGKLLEDLGVSRYTKKGTLPIRGPLLIISNHTGVFDSLLLFNKVDRNDLHFVALSTYGIFGDKVRERLLPIYRNRQLNHRIYEYPLCLQIGGCLPENLSVSEVRMRNRDTISKAASLVNKGLAVSIFPTGSAGKNMKGTKWKVGVGFLVKQITNPHTKIVFVRINGTKQSDLVAYLHPFIRRMFFKPRPITIEFSDAFTLKTVIDTNDEAKLIARKLEHLYQHHWETS